jgi:hypothetical protein|nr:MAG TPA: AAA domain protein [Caudoviricetes sp.]
MAIIVMVYGQSGTGKSTSLRNFKPEDVCIVNVSGKPLPFKNKHKTFNTDDYISIEAAIQKAPAKSIVIDDATYLMTGEYMRTAKVTGYQKFTELALNYYTLVKTAAALPDDKIVYFMGHSDIDSNGNEKFKTIGKLLDEKITLEGMFTIVLKTVVTDGKYQFSTRNSGQDTVKTPMGMFSEPLIENDLAAVDKAIREYYEI